MCVCGIRGNPPFPPLFIQPGPAKAININRSPSIEITHSPLGPTITFNCGPGVNTAWSNVLSMKW